MRFLILAMALIGLTNTAVAEQRYALLIGNEAYDGNKLTILENPIEDVARIEQALLFAGFEAQNITVLHDADEGEIMSAFIDLEVKLADAGEDGVGFVYYSGHGATYDDGRNRVAYMIPTGEGIEWAEDLLSSGVSIKSRVDALSRPGMGSVFFVVDACRNELKFRTAKSGSGVKGIGSVAAPSGLLVAFAAADGYFADDDSVFSTTLAEEIRKPGQRADVAFLNTASRVAAKKNDDTKRPVIQPRLTKPVCFVSCEADDEDRIWSLLETVGAYQAYLNQYPDGKYADAARERLNEAGPLFSSVTAPKPPAPDFKLVWDWHYGADDNDMLTAVTAKPDGGFIVSGYLGTGSDGSQDAIIASFDAEGTELWRRVLDGTKHDILRAMTPIGSSGFAAAGMKWKDADRSDVWVVRFDNDGNLLWDTTFGGRRDEWAWGMTELPGGRMAVAGRTNSEGAGGFDILVSIIGSRGEVVRKKTFGGAGDDEAKAIAALSDGGLVVVGWTKPAGVKEEDMVVWFLDADLNETSRLAVSRGGRQMINGVATTPDGGVVLVGMANRRGTKGEDFWVLALDEFGTTQFERVYGGAGKEVAEDVVILDDGTIVVTGLTSSKGGGWYDIWMVGLSPEGTLIWDRTVGEQKNEFANAIAELADGSLAVVGVTQSKGPAKDNLYVAKLATMD